MINKLDKELNYHHQALGTRVARQELLSSNIANADTPNFKAKDIDFSAVLSDKLGLMSQGTLRNVKLDVTSHMHFNSAAPGFFGDSLLYRVPLQPSADGNTVDMDMERTRFADNAIKYDASITFLNNEFRNLVSALQER
ncbi:MAG: flagellar basal body rod protein FlgB [Nitrosomonas sp.]|nr:MAG: flagellar basal body rod protein FlgB [Nitrosomonas sp.]